MTRKHLFKSGLAAAIVAVSALIGGSAQAVPFFAKNTQAFLQFYAIAIPTDPGALNGFGDASVTAGGAFTMPAGVQNWTMPGTSAALLADAFYYTDGAGNFNFPPYRTYILGGHPACVNLGVIENHQMPNTTGGGPGILATADSAYCGMDVGMQAANFAPGSGVGAGTRGTRLCLNKANISQQGVCTLSTPTIGGGTTPLPNSQQPPRVNLTPGAAQFGGTQSWLGVWKAGVNMSNPFTPAGGYFAYWAPVALTGLGGPTGATASVTINYTHQTLGFRIPGSAQVAGFNWTTGKVAASFWFSNAATGGSIAMYVTEATTGYDNRTSMYENGEIQLVSGYLSQGTNFGIYSGAVAMMRTQIEFVPEPAAIGLLAAGFLGLPVLYRVRNRRS